MTNTLTLLPMPRRVQHTGGTLALQDARLILLDGPRPQALLFTAQRLQHALKEHAGVSWEVVASTSTPTEAIAAVLRVDPVAVAHSQGYELMITPAGITAIAHDEAGLFYAVCTLSQIIELIASPLPCLTISDWPDYPARGIMLDISRDKVPTMETLYALVDMLAGWKINQLQLYTEHTFAYRQHEEVWRHASPITGQEVMELDAYCRQRYVELVPNQNSFGHVERWLIHPRYTHLGEGAVPNTTLCPIDPESLRFVAGLYDELLPHFTSRLFNVGCDETQVGQGRSKAEAERRGSGRVYLDFLLGIYREVKKRGFTMQFWGDIIITYPELIPELPTDSIALEWGYEADHPFAEHGARFAASGVPFYVCPGTSSWCTIAGRTDNALANTLGAAENGLRHGAIGYLNTDWGDRGHWQMLPMSFLGFAAGAAYSWSVESNRALDVAQAAGRHAFKDANGTMGRIAYNLGNVYQAVGRLVRNSSILFRVLQMPVEEIAKTYPDVKAGDYRRALDAIDGAATDFNAVTMKRPDSELIKDEYRHTVRLLRHACRRGLLAHETNEVTANDLRRELNFDMLGIIQEYTRLWLARNRPGGLADSLRRLEQARREYNWESRLFSPW